MAKVLGIDPKTLRKWARRGLVPSYRNKLNGYMYYFKQEVLQALRQEPGAQKRAIDSRHGKK